MYPGFNKNTVVNGIKRTLAAVFFLFRLQDLTNT